MVNLAELQRLGPAGDDRGALAWRLNEPHSPCLSSASVGGGLREVSWVLNVGVVKDYCRTDLDAHAAEVAHRASLSGPGAAMFTAADIARVEASDCYGVQAWSTVGVSRPTWPADREALAGAGKRLPGSAERPGTINTVVVLPIRLGPAALVQVALVVAEAKAQACVEAGIPGTGTASDAVVVACSPHGPTEGFGGPRSTWGARVALAVHAGVAAGLAGWPDGHRDGAC